MGIVEYEKGKFMLMGGSDSTGQKISRSCFLFDKMNGMAKTVDKMNKKRCHFGSIYHNNNIYVFGGYGHKSIYDDC